MHEADVRLSLPGRSAYVRLARLNAAGLAADLSFSVDEIEDLCIAVDELFFLLVDDPAREPAVELAYRVDGDDALVIEGVARFGADHGGELPVPDDLVREILTVTCDDWSFDGDPAERRFRLVKRRAQRP